jgi:RNA polymerase sigma-70 factor (ECF subfamily)
VAEPSDDALIAGLAAGDREAAAILVRRYQRRVFGLALSVLGDAGLAEDVAQEAFVRAWRHAEAFDPGRGSAAGWLLTITRNLAIDARRAQRARPVVPVEAIETGLLDEPGPDDLAVRAEDVRRVHAALGGLTVGQRRAVVLAAFGGRTAREIGEIDGIPLGTAKTRIRDGLANVRRALRMDVRGLS